MLLMACVGGSLVCKSSCDKESVAYLNLRRADIYQSSPCWMMKDWIGFNNNVLAVLDLLEKVYSKVDIPLIFKVITIGM